jgi:hypothetical protein
MAGFAAVVPGKCDTAAIRIKKDLASIKAHPIGGFEGSVDPIAINLARADAGNEHVPVVIRAVCFWIQRHNLRCTRIILPIKQQQLNR